MVKFILKNAICLALMMVVMTVSSCLTHVSEVPEPEDPAIPDINIPDGFNFETMRNVDISVDVDDRFQGRYFYAVEIYSANPFSDDNAKLLAKGIAKGGFPFEQKLSVTAVTEELYVKQIDPLKRESVVMCNVLDQIDCSFAATSSVKTKGGGVLRGKTASGLTVADYELPQGCVEITASNFSDWKEGGNYHVPANETLSFDGAALWHRNVSIYVSGTVTWDKLEMPAGNKLVVLPGGEVTIKNPNPFSQTAWLVVHGKGMMNITSNGKIQMDNTFTLINDGELSAKSLTITGSAKVINNGVLELGDKKGNGELSLESNGSYFENNGRFAASAIQMSTSATILNTCYVEIEKDIVCEGGNIELHNGSLLTSQNLTANNMKCEIRGTAVFNIKKKATFTSNNTIGGVYEENSDNTRPSVIIDEFGGGNSGNKKNVVFSGTLNVVCSSKHNMDEGYYTLEDEAVKLSDKVTEPVKPTDCNAGGIPEDPGDPAGPSDPDFPIVVPTADSYTFIMEDNWPQKGDYDMNDLVLEISKIVYSQTPNNRVESVQFQIELLAVGATRLLGAGMMFDNIPGSNISNVVSAGSPLDVSNYFSPGANGAEVSGASAVIPFFGDAHKTLGVNAGTITNTHMAAPLFPTVKRTFTISFKEPVAMKDANIANANFFILNKINKTERTEVHLAGRVASDKMLCDTKDFKTEDNLMWGCMIPYAGFKYPLENVQIVDAYPEFRNWCESGGRNSADWYKNPIEDKVYNKKE